MQKECVVNSVICKPYPSGSRSPPGAVSTLFSAVNVDILFLVHYTVGKYVISDAAAESVSGLMII